MAILLTERSVPVDLIGERIPGEADDGNAAIADPQNVGPFLPQPSRSFLSCGTLCEICLCVHDGQAIPFVILPCDLGVSEDLSGRPSLPVRRDAVFVRNVIVVS